MNRTGEATIGSTQVIDTAIMESDHRSTSLPDEEVLYRAFLTRDSSYDGTFVTAVKTTGIFCRPTCRARKPLRKNVEFFGAPHDAILAGYRPCKVCRPLSSDPSEPAWVRAILEEIHADPSITIRDYDLVARGIEPARIRRWFKAHTGLTFHAYHRSLRISRALGDVASGASATEAAFDSGYESLSGFSSAVKRSTGRSTTAGGRREPVQISRISTPLGPMVCGVTSRFLYLLEFIDRRAIESQLSRLRKLLGTEILPGHAPLHTTVRSQLAEYFCGDRTQFDLPIETPGSPFQQQVWKALLEIRYGETRSYAAQAEAIGRPAAVRAVARANGANRLAIVVPCHRVVGSDGSLTGYGGGLMRKQRLLDLEAGRIRW